MSMKMCDMPVTVCLTCSVPPSSPAAPPQIPVEDFLSCSEPRSQEDKFHVRNQFLLRRRPQRLLYCTPGSSAMASSNPTAKVGYRGPGCTIKPSIVSLGAGTMNWQLRLDLRVDLVPVPWKFMEIFTEFSATVVIQYVGCWKINGLDAAWHIRSRSSIISWRKP